MSYLVIDGYTQAEIDAALASDDPELIERMLSGEKVSVGEEEPADNETTATNEGLESSEKTQDEQGATSGTEDGDATAADAQEEERYIESKQGGNKIPYVVLEKTRQERDTLKDQLTQAQQKLSALESKSTAMQSHLEKAGIDLAALEKGEQLTEEQLAELENIDPAVAKLARITMSLFDRVESVQTRIDTATTQSPDPVIQAIESNKDLSAWQKSDPDRWETAVFYDEQLKNTPAFKDKPYAVRFAEAVRLTKSAFGDPVDEIKPRENVADIAAQKVAAAKTAAVPRSLTDLGKSPTSERPLGEVMADLDPAALAEKMADMSPDQIERMLAELG